MKHKLAIAGSYNHFRISVGEDYIEYIYLTNHYKLRGCSNTELHQFYGWYDRWIDVWNEVDYYCKVHNIKIIDRGGNSK